MVMGMNGKALAGVQQLDEQTGVHPEAIQVGAPQSRFRLLLDRLGQRPAVRQNVTPSDFSPAIAVVDATQSSGSRSPAGGSPRKLRDSLTAAVEAVGRAIRGKQNYVHEA